MVWVTAETKTARLFMLVILVQMGFIHTVSQSIRSSTESEQFHESASQPMSEPVKFQRTYKIDA